MAKVGSTLFSIALYCSTAIAGDGATPDPASSVWRTFTARQIEATTATVSWTKRFHKSAAAVRIDMSDGDLPGEALTATEIDLPPAECLLSLSGETACRYENVGLSFAHGNRGAPYQSIITFDEKGTYWSFTENSGVSKRHSGRVDERKSPPVWDALHIKPLVLALRPLRPEAFGPSPSGWSLEHSRAVIDGRECLVLSGRPPAFASGNAIYEVFLDIGRDYVPLRYAGRNRASRKLFSQIDISYDRDEAPTWVPSSWKVTSFLGSGDLSEASENDEVEVTLGLTIPDETFRIDFPAGTSVSDGRKGGEMFIVGKDRMLVPRRLAEAEELSGGAKRWPWLLAAAGAAALGSALLIWWRGHAGT